MLSMCELRRSVSVLESFLPGCTMKRIVSGDSCSLILTFIDSTKRKTEILVSCHPEFARICIASGSRPSRLSTATFFEYVRAHLTGTVVAGIELADNNRQVRFDLASRTDSWKLYLSILGPRSNIYLTDAEGRLVHAMRSLDETRRDLRIGDSWSDPAGSVPSEGLDRWADVTDDVYLETVGNTYDRLELHREAELLARKIGQVLTKEKAMLNRKLNRLNEDLEKARQAETYLKKGELLKGVLHSIKPGDNHVTATDYKTGEKVEIALDSTISPAANLNKYFSRYQKDSRGEEMIRQQVRELQSLRDEIDEIENRLESALHKDPPDIKALEDASSLSLIRRLVGRYAPRDRKEVSRVKSKTGNEIPSRLRPKRYRTDEGLEVWVGKNDEGNDYLTTRMARGNDLFFHLEGYPGSHVILRTDGRSDPPSDSVLDACELAVHFSRMKNAGSADVHIAPIKNVKKPKGAKPGLVYVRQGKTIHLRRNPNRLRNILASRVDD